MAHWTDRFGGRRLGTRRVRGLRAVAAAALLVPTMQIVLQEAAVADPTATTDDASVTVKVKSWWYTGVDQPTVTNLLATNNARLTGIEVDSGSPTPTFSVTMVLNAGPYKVAGWSWQVGRTAAQVASDLTAANGRLVDLTPYLDAVGNERFAEVIVPNTGPTARTWWYVVDGAQSDIIDVYTVHDARLETVKTLIVGGQRRYFGIFVDNGPGRDSKGWYWNDNISRVDLAASLASGDYRLVSYYPDPFGGVDAVLYASRGERWSYSEGVTAAQLATAVSTTKARVISVAHEVGGSTKLDAVLLEDDNVASKPVNAESTRVHNYMATGFKGGLSGFSLRKVGGPILLGDNLGFRWETASAIKIAYALFAMKQVQAGADNLDTPGAFTYYNYPPQPSIPAVCPDPSLETPSNAVHTTLRDGLQRMLYDSDNRTTRGMALRYGLAPVNAMLASMGLTGTHIGQDRIGCGFAGGHENTFTAADAASLYSQIDDGSILTPTNIATLYSFMNFGFAFPGSYWQTVVRAEAALLGLSTVVADDFLSRIDTRIKGGGYSICQSVDCRTYETIRTNAGKVTLPFKASPGGAVVPTDYTFGIFVNEKTVTCPASGACPQQQKVEDAVQDKGFAELFRAEIRQALTTW